MSNKTKSYALSDSDIVRIMKGKVKVIPYNELVNYSTIQEVLSPYGQAVILYLTKENYGHYTCVIDQGDSILFFDSYSDKPDREFDNIDKKSRQQYNYKGYPYLSKLLLNSGKKIEYNHHQLQRDGKETGTCGRWCVVKMLLKDIRLNEFIDIFSKFSDPDEIVTKITNQFF